MTFEYSKNNINKIKRIKKLKNIYQLIGIFTLIMIINFSLISSFELFPLILIVILISFLVGFLIYCYILFVCNITQEALNHELNPKLFIDYNVFLLKEIYKKTKYQKYVLSDIATGYLYDGNFDKCREILNYIENEKNDKIIKITILEKRMIMFYFEKDKNEFLKSKELLLTELDDFKHKLKDQILFNIEMYTALIEEDKKKLINILKVLKNSDKNLDKVDYLYIKSQLFEEEDNKYQKKLAFEGGDIFYAKEELEDQSISTKNNIKQKKHKVFVYVSILFLIVSIISTIISFIIYFL